MGDAHDCTLCYHPVVHAVWAEPASRGRKTGPANATRDGMGQMICYKFPWGLPGEEGAEIPALSVYVTLPCTRTAVPGRSADSCQIIQQCLSPEFGESCLIHPCQLHGAAVWDPRGGGLELKTVMRKCYFRSTYLGEHQQHFDALFHPKPSREPRATASPTD